jgi:GT2 family glycosyltransferase
MDDIRVVIVTFNSSATILRCVRSFLNAGIAEDQLMVMDNASSDDTAVLVRSAFPSVSLTVQHENLGYGTAVNRAIPGSEVRYLVIANPDIEVFPETISLSVDALDRNPSAAAAGCRLIDADGNDVTRFSPTGIVRAAGMILFDQAFSGLVRSGQQMIRSGISASFVNFIEGSFMIVRSEAFRAVKGFDEKIFLFSEDADLCLRLRRAGWKLLNVPNVNAIHLGGTSFSPEGKSVRNVELYRGLLYFYTKNFPFRSLLLMGALAAAIGLKLFWLGISDFAGQKKNPRKEIYHAIARMLY